jgi:acyl-CoA reductase-like NAD-dependent aldehyde dehydrogenase
MMNSYNPLNGEIVGTVEVTPPGEMSGIVGRARRAQATWGNLEVGKRAELLAGAAPRFMERAEELAHLITREMGKPIRESLGEARGIGAGIESELEQIAQALEPEKVQAGNIHSVIYRDPLGVCAAITPWNFPVAMPHWMVLPALAAGNTVVFKPSEETPLCGQAYADILGEDLPPDVLITVHGADEQGRALVQSEVDLVAFTGSREVGKEILHSTATSLRRVILELGGKDPMIVLEDADLVDAARFAAWNGFRNAGQVCVSTERILVQDRVAEEFLELLAGEAKKAVVGDGLEKATIVGPMVNARQREHVISQVRDAVQNGARVLVGGGQDQAPFISPTVLVDVPDTLSIAKEETFGPVVCVTRFGSEEEAVGKANASPFGLGAVVFGGDEKRAERIARQLNAGMVGINRACGGAPGTPWVGARESGYGFHKGRDGHRQFTQCRVVSRAV